LTVTRLSAGATIYTSVCARLYVYPLPPDVALASIPACSSVGPSVP